MQIDAEQQSQPPAVSSPTTAAARRRKTRDSNRSKRLGAVRADIVNPVGCSWNDLGNVLRGLRSMAHRVINDAAFADEISRRDNCGVAPETVAYRAATWAAAALTQWSRERKDEQERVRAVEPSSNVVLGWANRAHDNVQRWHADEKAHRPSRLPTMKSGAPIYVPRVAWDLLPDGDDGLLLSVSLLAGRNARHTVRLQPYRGANWGILRSIAAGEVEAGALQIVYDERARRKSGKRGKWTVLIAHKQPKSELRSGNGTLVVHRGQKNFAWLLPSTGKSGGKPISGHNIKAQKERWQARAYQIKRGSNPAEQGAGARGHGRQRRFRDIDHVRGRQTEIMTTLCRQVAAEIVKLALMWECASVAIENYGGIEPHAEREVRRFMQRFPLYLLKQSIARACETAGLTLVEVPSFYISSICPRCSSLDANAHNIRTGIFHCQSCGLDEQADSVAAYHMLCAVYPDGGTPVHAARERARKMADKIKKVREKEKEAPPVAAE